MQAKTKIAGLVVALMALSVPMVYADNGTEDKDSSHQAGDWHHGQKDHMMGKILNLSETQEKQLKDSREKQKDTMKGVFDQMKSNREAFDAEIAKAAPDMNKVNDIQAQLKTIQAQMADNHLNSILETKKILTPEQFTGYMALQKERRMMGREDHEDKHWGQKDNKKDKDQDND